MYSPVAVRVGLMENDTCLRCHGVSSPQRETLYRSERQREMNLFPPREVQPVKNL
jgi:hypothetical protein